MKKIFALLLIIPLVLMVTACSKKEKLYILNWGDYINRDLLDEFEREYNCEIVYEEEGSNERFETLISTDSYDLVFPSEYMIKRMIEKGLVQKLDFTKLPDYKDEAYFPEVLKLRNDAGISEYSVPYLWGTVGILYNTSKVGLKEYVEEKGLASVFEKSSYNVGMYDSARDAISMALLYLGYSVNDADKKHMQEAATVLKNASYRVWGEDDLKEKVASGTQLDLALVYSGDYLDQLYKNETDGIPVNFDYFVPEETNAWLDGCCIPTSSKNPELAYKFINFLQDPERFASNCDAIGYCPTMIEAYNLLLASEDEGGYGYEIDENVFFPYPEGTKRQVYTYVSEERYNLLNQLLLTAKEE